MSDKYDHDGNEFQVGDVVRMDHETNPRTRTIKAIIPPETPGFETAYWWADFTDSPDRLRLDWLRKIDIPQRNNKMSCTNYAAYISGVKFSLSKDLFRIPNKLYGIVKYDPETGEKVEPTKFDEKQYDVVISFIESKDTYKNQNIFSTYDECSRTTTRFCGIAYKLSDDAVQKIPDVLPSKPEWYSELINMLKLHNIPYEEGNFLVSHTSC
jgi:hypothetical protein